MRLAIVSTSSPLSRRSWSGIPYFATKEITRRFADVHIVDTALLDRLVIKAHKFRKGQFQLLREPLLVKSYGLLLDRMLARIAPDAVISIGAPQKIGGLLDKYRTYHVADAMFDTVIRYYPKYRHMNARSARLGHELQKSIVDKSSGLLLASHWAAQSAAQHYCTPLDRFTIAPMGANLETAPPAIAPRKNDAPLKLLFVGYDWHRKGGALCLEALGHIRRSDPDAELHVVGCNPRSAHGVAGVHVHGPLSKAYGPHADLFRRLFETSHFFIMPSHQEAYGLVYCEACAFSLPPVARDTGGVGEIVKHGENGLLLPGSADAREYADAILHVWRDANAYAKMQKAARSAFETRLNWQAWGDTLEQVLTDSVEGPCLRATA